VTAHTRLALGLCALLVTLNACGGGGGSSGSSRPNIVLLIADDLGWNDVSYHGSEIATPNIDQLAREGVELDRFYAAPVCSPTRMGILTGRYAMRWGMMDSAVRPWETLGLPPEETTLPEVLADAGYATRALIGKWHAGHASRRYHPLEQGFSSFYGFYNGAIDYFSHAIAGEVDWHRDYEPVDEGRTYSTDLITTEAIRVIHAAAAAGEPFLLSVNYNAPHLPLAAPEACRERFTDISDETRQLFAAVVGCMDDAIGRVLAAIDDASIRDNTLVWFLSDNGGHLPFGGRNTPLRGQKLEVYEGGIRVPAVVRWPAGGLEGGRRNDAPIAYVDILPTLARLLGVEHRLPAVLDGIDVLDVLGGQGTARERELFSYQGPNLFTGQEGPEGTALLRGPWKLVRIGPNILEHPKTPGRIELFAIDTDPRETTNLAAEHPELVDEMLARIADLRALQPPDVALSPLEPPPGWVAPPRWRIPAD